MSTKHWQSYEEVAAHLLSKFAEHFGLGNFEGKQVLPGASGTSWEIDAKGVNTTDGTFVVVECKRYMKGKVAQETVAGLSYRIQDLGAEGGIIVTPVGLQEGASKVAAHEGIVLVQLHPDSTTTKYVMRFLNQICLGLEERIRITESLTITVTDNDGNVVDRRQVDA